MSTATTGEFALDANPKRLIIQSELLAATDAATLATAIDALTNRNFLTDAQVLLVNELNKFKGEHANAAALETAWPAASQQNDAWAFLEDTDSVWVIDADTVTWKDTHTNTAPASVDSALSAASTNAVSNQAITNELNTKTVQQVFPIPGDNALVSFNITHTLTTFTGGFVRKAANKEAVSLKVEESSATVVAVGPFATAPADATTFEVVLTGTKNV